MPKSTAINNQGESKMKNFAYKQYAICLFSTVGLLAMAGCSPTDDGKGTTTQVSTLQTVLQRGTLRVGDCLSFAPFGFYDKAGQPDGYDVDLAKELAKDMGVKL